MKKITLFSVAIAIIFSIAFTSCHSYGKEVSEEETIELWSQLEGYWLEKRYQRFSSFEDAQEFAMNGNFEEIEDGLISHYYIYDDKMICEIEMYYSTSLLLMEQMAIGYPTFHKKNGSVCQVMELVPKYLTVEVFESITSDYYIYSVHSSDPEANNYPYYGVRKRVESPEIMYNALLETISPIAENSVLTLTRKVEYNTSNNTIQYEIIYDDNQPAFQLIKYYYLGNNHDNFEYHLGIGTYSITNGYVKDAKNRAYRANLGYYHYGVTDSLYLTIDDTAGCDYSKCLIEKITSSEVILDCEMKSDSTIKTKLYFTVKE